MGGNRSFVRFIVGRFLAVIRGPQQNIACFGVIFPTLLHGAAAGTDDCHRRTGICRVAVAFLEAAKNVS